MKPKFIDLKNKILSSPKSVQKFLKEFKRWEIITFLILIAFALFFRFANLVDLGLKFDTVETQYIWGKSAFDLGYGPFWAQYRGFFDYLPGAVLFLLSVDGISRLLDPILPGGADYSFVILIKILNSFADFALVLIIYFLARRKSKISVSKSAIFASSFFAIPSLWFVSSIWGQFDTLVVVFAILSIIFFYLAQTKDNSKLIKNYAFWAGVFFALGFWLKVQIMIIIPVLLILFFLEKIPRIYY